MKTNQTNKSNTILQALLLVNQAFRRNCKIFFFGRKITKVSILAILLSFTLFSHTDTKALELDETLKEEQVYDLLNRFSSVINVIKENYYGEVNSSQLIDLAIKGMLTNLDPYSAYFSQKDYAEFNQGTTGQYGGIGLTITEENNYIKIISSFDNSPGARAGLKTDDYIVKVGDQSLRGVSVSDAAIIMRGKPGTKVKLTIARPGAEEFEVEITREVITIPNVSWFREGDVGYIRIAGFDNQALSGLENAVTNLKKGYLDSKNKTQLAKPKAYILDLRSNPGGLLSMAIDISDAFLERGEIVSTRGRDDTQVSRFNAKAGDIIDGLPLVLLLDKGSASASEVVAGALRDHDRAILLGTKSYGKASVQSVFKIGEQSEGVIKLTIKRYYTPKGELIHEKGVEPNVVVEQKEVPDSKKVESYRETTNNDLQLLEALEILHKK